MEIVSLGLFGVIVFFSVVNRLLWHSGEKRGPTSGGGGAEQWLGETLMTVFTMLGVALMFVAVLVWQVGVALFHRLARKEA
ncbi:MAG: hypothetical protein H6737_01970 [Alphaproteobacteria bacterium]|nr:hypothetical protein [Alphaproteobacteria bacterium]